MLCLSEQAGVTDSAVPEAPTFSDTNSISPISYFPNDKRFLFRSDQGGNEIWHIYVYNVDGSTKDLTPGEKSRSLFLEWAHDEQSFFYTSNKRNPKYMDVYEIEINSFISKMIFENNDALNVASISNDKQYMALNKTYNRDNSDLYLYNIKNKSLKIAFLAVYAVIIQFFGYGLAFVKSTILITFSNKKPEQVFPKLFFS